MNTSSTNVENFGTETRWTLSTLSTMVDPLDPGLVPLLDAMKQLEKWRTDVLPNCVLRDGYVIIFEYTRRTMKLPVELEELSARTRPQILMPLGTPLSDQVFRNFVRNARNRGFSPHKVGAYFQVWLNSGTFEGIKTLAAATGVQAADVERALNLAQLPLPVVWCLGRQERIKVAWIERIVDAMKINGPAVLETAYGILHLSERPTPRDALEMLSHSVSG